MKKLIQGDCLTCDLEPHHCVIADPPDNIGLKYENYRDRVSNDEYNHLLFQVVKRITTLAIGVAWLSHHSKHTATVWRIVNSLCQEWEVRQVIWRYTFGQYDDRDMGYGYRPILRIRNPEWTMQPQREESERMRLGDSRAATNADGTARLRVHDDVWDFPRVVGNSVERQSWHPTQHPVILYDRMIKWTAATTVLDLFAGSGTIFRAARLNPGVHVTGVEIDPTYCKRLRADYGLT